MKLGGYVGLALAFKITVSKVKVIPESRSFLGQFRFLLIAVHPRKLRRSMDCHETWLEDRSHLGLHDYR